MDTKKILKMVIVITVMLSSSLQIQPTSANDETDRINSLIQSSPELDVIELLPMIQPDVMHEVVFELNGGSGFFPPQIVLHGDVAEIPFINPVREGYEFMGWFVDFDGYEPFDSSSLVLNDMIIYALWEQIPLLEPVRHWVIFNLNGGSGFFLPQFRPQIVNHEDMAVMPDQDPVRSGYEFIGWFIDRGGIKPFDFSTSITENIIVHAAWAPIVIPDPITHLVMFELNGGSGFFHHRLSPMEI